MTDAELIEHLRDIANQRAKTAAYGGCDVKLITEWIAADRLVSLLKEVERLKAALKPFADTLSEDTLEPFVAFEGDDKPLYADTDMINASEWMDLTYGDLRRARAAYEGKP